MLNNEQVVLATAVVNVRDRFGQLHLAGALLDSGSQIILMSGSMAQMLRLKREPTSLAISMVGGATIDIKNKICASIESRINSRNFSADCWVLKSISTTQPAHSMGISNWKISKNIKLADLEFYRPAKVDILLGAELFYELLCVGQIKLNYECKKRCSVG